MHNSGKAGNFYFIFFAFRYIYHSAYHPYRAALVIKQNFALRFNPMQCFIWPNYTGLVIVNACLHSFFKSFFNNIPNIIRMQKGAHLRVRKHTINLLPKYFRKPGRVYYVHCLQVKVPGGQFSAFCCQAQTGFFYFKPLPRSYFFGNIVCRNHYARYSTICFKQWRKFIIEVKFFKPIIAININKRFNFFMAYPG